MAIGPMSTALFPGVLLSAALSHCVGAGMEEGIAVGVVGFLLSSIALGAFTRHMLGRRRAIVTLLLAAGGGIIVGLVGLTSGAAGNYG